MDKYYVATKYKTQSTKYLLKKTNKKQHKKEK